MKYNLNIYLLEDPSLRIHEGREQGHPGHWVKDDPGHQHSLWGHIQRLLFIKVPENTKGDGLVFVLAEFKCF